METKWRRSLDITIDNDAVPCWAFRSFSRKHPMFRHQENPRLSSEDVRSSSRSLIAHPYRPWEWMWRATVLIQADIPELAVGDAHKALLLVHAQDDDLPCGKDVQNEIRTNWELIETDFIDRERVENLNDEHREEYIVRSLGLLAYQILGVALLQINAFHDCRETVKAAQGKYPRDELLAEIAKQADIASQAEYTAHLKNGHLPAAAAEMMRTGTYNPRLYPWITTQIAERQKPVLAALAERLDILSTSALEIRASELNVDSEGAQMGVFAVIDIKAGENILVEATPFTARESVREDCASCRRNLRANGYHYTICCQRAYCSKKCWAQAQRVFHGDEADCKDERSDAKFLSVMPRLRRPYDMKVHEHDPLMAKIFARILTAAVIQSKRLGCLPLLVPFLNGLACNWGSTNAVDFSYAMDIVFPNEILTALGIDIFADHEMDTWVIQVMLNKLRTNFWTDRCEGEDWEGISPLFSFFNHSCRPNAEMALTTRAGVKLTLTAIANINAGEEVLVSYISRAEDTQKMSFEERQLALQAWFQKCACQLCAKESMKGSRKVGALRRAGCFISKKTFKHLMQQPGMSNQPLAKEEDRSDVVPLKKKRGKTTASKKQTQTDGVAIRPVNMPIQKTTARKEWSDDDEGAPKKRARISGKKSKFRGFIVESSEED